MTVLSSGYNFNTICPGTNGTAVPIVGDGCGNPTFALEVVHNDTILNLHYEEYSLNISVTDGYILAHLAFSQPIDIDMVDISAGVYP